MHFEHLWWNFVRGGIVCYSDCLDVPRLFNDLGDVSDVAQSGEEEQHDADIDAHGDQTMILLVSQLA